MNRAGASVMLFLAALALSGPPVPRATAASSGPGPDAGRGGLGRLWRLAGTFDYNAVLYHPRVSRALYELLGGREKRRLIDTLQIVRAITSSGDYLILQGHPAAADPEAAMIAVGRRGSLDVALLHGARVTLFITEPQLASAAPPILAAAEQWASRAHATLSVRHGVWTSNQKTPRNRSGRGQSSFAAKFGLKVSGSPGRPCPPAAGIPALPNVKDFAPEGNET